MTSKKVTKRKKQASPPCESSDQTKESELSMDAEMSDYDNDANDPPYSGEGRTDAVAPQLINPPARQIEQAPANGTSCIEDELACKPAKQRATEIKKSGAKVMTGLGLHEHNQIDDYPGLNSLLEPDDFLGPQKVQRTPSVRPSIQTPVSRRSSSWSPPSGKEREKGKQDTVPNNLPVRAAGPTLTGQKVRMDVWNRVAVFLWHNSLR